MTKPFLVACALASAVTFGACSVYAQTSQPGMQQTAKSTRPMGKVSTATFVPKAQISDLYEIEAGRIAVQRAQKPEVKAFAQRMVDHHTMAASKFSAAMREAKVNAAVPSLDTEHLNKLEALRTASTTAFDRMYVAQQVEAHEAALRLHRAYAAGGDKAPLKAAAREATTMVEQHLQDIRGISGGIASES